MLSCLVLLVRTGCAGYLLVCSQVHFSPFLHSTLQTSQVLLLWLLSSANVGRTRRRKAWLSLFASKSGCVFYLDSASWKAVPSVHAPSSPSLVLLSSQACLSFTLHQFQIPSFCNNQGDFYFLTGAWQTQGWSDVLNYNRIFYLPFSLQLPPYNRFVLPSYFLFVEEYFGSLNTFLKHGKYHLSYPEMHYQYFT